MPLQIRRGTKAELNLLPLPLAEGELVYVTDEEKLYIGNGADLGGLAVTGFSAEEAQDAAALLFSTGTHSGISFTYNDVDGKINATVAPPDIEALTQDLDVDGFDITSGVTTLLNGANGSVNLNGTVKAAIVPDANNAYDIGSPSFRFQDIYAGTSLNVGTAAITATGSVINLPAGSTVNNVPIEPIAEGSNYKINIAGADSTILISSDDNVIGNFTSTMQFSDAFAETNSFNFHSNNVDPLIVFAKTAPGTPPGIIINSSSGSYETPTNTAPGDVIGAYKVSGYYGGSYKFSSGVLNQWDGDANLTTTHPKSSIALVTGTNGSTLNQAVFNGSGVFSAPIMQTGSFTTVERDALTPAVGMMIYNTTDNKFQGYQNTGGTTLEWVNLS
jgi:hypothetical protein